MAGHTNADDIDIRIGFAERNPNVQYVGWTTCTDMEGGNAGDKAQHRLTYGNIGDILVSNA